MAAAPRVERRRVVLGGLLIGAAASSGLLAACSRKPRYSTTDFIGQWHSSKALQPIVLYSNGEWELRNDDGKVQQYGIWELQGDYLVWIVKVNGRLERDANRVLSASPREFQLQEASGISIFTRIE